MCSVTIGGPRECAPNVVMVGDVSGTAGWYGLDVGSVGWQKIGPGRVRLDYFQTGSG